MADDTYDERVARLSEVGISVCVMSPRHHLMESCGHCDYAYELPVPAAEGQVMDALSKLDGTTASAVSLLTGQSREELDALGGFSDEDSGPYDRAVIRHLHPWTVEMLSAIADANEAYKEDDCE